MHTKQLLDPINLDDAGLTRVEVKQDIFVKDGNPIKYNSLILTFEDGQEIRIKPEDSKQLKMELYTAIMLNTKLAAK
jgi:hypothetical protein